MRDWPGKNQMSDNVRPKFWVHFGLTAAACVCSCAALGVGYWMGMKEQPATQAALPPMLAASATATDTMAIATGPISNDVEGIFFLDFLTGRLQCLVFYPRTGTFGARFAVDVAPHLGSGKNSKFLMVTGQSIVQSAASNFRPGSLISLRNRYNHRLFRCLCRTVESLTRNFSAPASGRAAFHGWRSDPRLHASESRPKQAGGHCRSKQVGRVTASASGSDT